MGTRLVIWAALCGLIGIVYVYSPEFLSNMISVLRDGNVETIAAYIRSFGVWAVFISILLSIIMTFGLVIPFVILATANGAVFGIAGGTLVSWLGEVVGALVAFSLYRYFLRPAIVKRLSHTQYWCYVDKLSNEHGFKTVLISRILPVIPSGILTAAASISNISLWDFWWATAIGKIPSVFAKVVVGHDLLYFEAHKTRLLTGLLFLALLYFAAAWWRKR